MVLVTSCDSSGGVHLPLVSICTLVSIYKYRCAIAQDLAVKLIGCSGRESIYAQIAWGVHLHLVSVCALVSIYSYKLTVLNGGGGSFGFGIYMVSKYSYKLTVSNGEGGHLALVSKWSLYILIS